MRGRMRGRRELGLFPALPRTFICFRRAWAPCLAGPRDRPLPGGTCTGLGRNWASVRAVSGRLVRALDEVRRHCLIGEATRDRGHAQRDSCQFASRSCSPKSLLSSIAHRDGLRSRPRSLCLYCLWLSHCLQLLLPAAKRTYVATTAKYDASLIECVYLKRKYSSPTSLSTMNAISTSPCCK